MIQVSYTAWDIIQAFPQETIIFVALLAIMPLVTLEMAPPGSIRVGLVLVALACAAVSRYTTPAELWLITSGGFSTHAKFWGSLFYALTLLLSNKAGNKACTISAFALIAFFLLVSSKD